IGALTLFCANGIVARLAFRFPLLEQLLEGEPTLLVEDGRILVESLRREVMTRTELERAIRKHDLDPATDLPLIKRALLEEDGTVTIIRQGEDSQDHRRRRIGRLSETG
ncbi:MAG: YetF domain-containing protein, partial [Chloroflexota bacterium]